MAQLVSAILSNQGALEAVARNFTGDVNEASLLVGRVVTRAFTKMDPAATPDAISSALRRDLDALMNQRFS
ncbi:MAG: hypothetical protein AB7P07_03760 [Hyphomonadaceae bacterium]